MSRPCPTCKSDRCGNHAACARRKAEKAQYEASGQQRHAYFWFMWRIQWLYIGAYAYLGILSSIEDGKAREEATHAAAKQLSNQMLIFILYATSQGAAEREASVLRAHNIVEWQK